MPIIFWQKKVNLVGTVRCTNIQLFKNIGNWLTENISLISKVVELKLKYHSEKLHLQ